MGAAMATHLGAADGRAAVPGDDDDPSDPIQCSITPQCTFDGQEIVCRFDLRCTVE